MEMNTDEAPPTLSADDLTDTSQEGDYVGNDADGGYKNKHFDDAIIQTSMLTRDFIALVNHCDFNLVDKEYREVAAKILAQCHPLIQETDTSLCNLIHKCDSTRNGGLDRAPCNLRRLQLLAGIYGHYRDKVLAFTGLPKPNPICTIATINEKWKQIDKAPGSMIGFPIMSAGRVRKDLFLPRDQHSYLTRLRDDLRKQWNTLNLWINNGYKELLLATGTKVKDSLTGHLGEVQDELLSILPNPDETQSLSNIEVEDEETLSTHLRSRKRQIGAAISIAIGESHEGMSDRIGHMLLPFSSRHSQPPTRYIKHSHGSTSFADLQETTNSDLVGRQMEQVLRPSVLWTGGIALVEHFDDCGDLTWLQVDTQHRNGSTILDECLMKQFPAILTGLRELGYDFRRSKNDGYYNPNDNLEVPDRVASWYTGRYDNGKHYNEFYIQRRGEMMALFRTVYCLRKLGSHADKCNYFTPKDLKPSRGRSMSDITRDEWNTLPTDKQLALQLYACFTKALEAESQNIAHKEKFNLAIQREIITHMIGWKALHTEINNHSKLEDFIAQEKAIEKAQKDFTDLEKEEAFVARLGKYLHRDEYLRTEIFTKDSPAYQIPGEDSDYVFNRLLLYIEITKHHDGTTCGRCDPKNLTKFAEQFNLNAEQLAFLFRRWGSLELSGLKTDTLTTESMFTRLLTPLVSKANLVDYYKGVMEYLKTLGVVHDAEQIYNTTNWALRITEDGHTETGTLPLRALFFQGQTLADLRPDISSMVHGTCDALPELVGTFRSPLNNITLFGPNKQHLDNAPDAITYHASSLCLDNAGEPKPALRIATRHYDNFRRLITYMQSLRVNSTPLKEALDTKWKDFQVTHYNGNAGVFKHKYFKVDGMRLTAYYTLTAKIEDFKSSSSLAQLTTFTLFWHKVKNKHLRIIKIDAEFIEGEEDGNVLLDDQSLITILQEVEEYIDDYNHNLKKMEEEMRKTTLQDIPPPLLFTLLCHIRI